MTSTEIILLAICIFLGFLVLSYLLMNFLIVPLIISKKIYRHWLVRETKEDWGHRCSDETNYEQRLMWDAGIAWAEKHKDVKKPVHIVSDGYNLYGEYFDFGYDKSVIIVPGRTETWTYSYFYAPSYERAGYNVLVIDKRAHGFSDGRYGDMGKFSSIDIINWAKMIHEQYGINNITLHGICIGCSICLYAYNRPECPDYVNRLVVEGMFTTFYDSFYRHMKEQKRPTHPYCWMIMKYAQHNTHENYIHEGPIFEVKNCKKPVLFLFTTQDHYTYPEEAKAFLEKCGSKQKKLVWFEKGLHSHIRINNEEAYDKAIADFTEETK